MFNHSEDSKMDKVKESEIKLDEQIIKQAEEFKPNSPEIKIFAFDNITEDTGEKE